MGNLWVRPYQRDKDRSELGVLAGKLDSEGGEYQLEVAPIFKVS